MNTIGKNIAYFRKKAGFTQEELSKKMSVTSQAISKWENDLSYPDLPSTKMLADILQVSTDELFNGEVNYPLATDEDEDQIARRILVIRVQNEENESWGTPATNVTVRFPVSVLLEASENGTLRELVDDDEASSIEMAMGMIKKGVTGTLVDVQTGDCSTQIVVEDYEN